MLPSTSRAPEMRVASRASAREGWILAGTLDGRAAAPALDAEVAGMPHVLRHACALVAAGATRIFVVWLGDDAPPDLAGIAQDARLAGRAVLELVGALPDGAGDDPVLLARADRVFHRDLPRLLAGARRQPGQIAAFAGEGYDSVLALDREDARALAAAAAAPAGWTRAVADLRTSRSVLDVAPPWLGFSMAAADPRALREAERRLVGSLRKPIDGLAAQLINRRVSLPVTRRLAGTRVRPNHVTVGTFLAGIAGCAILAQGGYLAGVIGMILFELGSIFDGVDGELARLRYQSSLLGQWLDTLSDDLANLLLAGGTAANLYLAGQTWPVLVAGVGAVAFAIGQGAQYYLLATVYHSGDLLALPWGFQRSGPQAGGSPLVARLGALVSRLLKRDFFVTLFLVLAIAGRLETVVVLFSAGAVAALAAFLVQLPRLRRR